MNDERRDLLIARVVEGCAERREWDELLAAAEADESIWREVVRSQRDQAELLVLADRAAAVAGGIALAGPRPEAARRRQRSRTVGGGGGAMRWSGWAVAALLLVGLGLQLRAPGLPPAADRARRRGTGTMAPRPLATSSVVPVSNATEALRAYLDKGRAEGTVLSRQPRRVLLETRPNPAGPGFELIYVQQIMERAIVPNLFQVRGLDEEGRPTLMRLRRSGAPPM